MSFIRNSGGTPALAKPEVKLWRSVEGPAGDFAVRPCYVDANLGGRMSDAPPPKPAEQEKDSGSGKGREGLPSGKLSKPGHGEVNQIEAGYASDDQQAAQTFPAPAEAEPQPADPKRHCQCQLGGFEFERIESLAYCEKKNQSGQGQSGEPGHPTEREKHRHVSGLCGVHSR